MIESIALRLNELWLKRNKPAFVLQEPCKLTYCCDGKFSRQPFIGEEEMEAIGAYVGKKGELILQFRETGSSGGHVEMSASDARRHFAEFAQYFNDVMSFIEDDAINGIAEVGRAKEDTADMEARRASNPLFGSW